MQPIKLDDFLTFAAVSSPSCAPSGDAYTWVKHRPDVEHNTYTHDLYLSAGGKPTCIADALPAEPFWLDGETFLYASRAGAGRGSRFMKYHIPTGTAEETLCLPFRGQIAAALPEGKYLVQATVNVTEQRRTAGLSGPAQEQEWAAIDEENDMVWVIDEFPYWQNGQGLTNKLRTGLYIADAAGSVQRITEELFNVENVAYSAARAQVFFAGASYDSRKQYWSGVYVYDVREKTVRCLIPEGHYEIGFFGLAGDRIILTACRQDQGQVLAQMHDLYAMDLDTGTLTLLHSGELSFGDGISTDVTHGGGCQFVAQEDAVYFLCCVEEHTELMRYSYTGAPETLLEVYGAINAFAVGEKQIIFAAVKDMNLSALYCLDPAGVVTQLTDYNDTYCASHTIVWPREVRFVNYEGNEVHGLVLLPPDFDPEQTYPAILGIHGGPRAAYGTVFYHEMQYWASEGYVVMFCNPTGSLGRGQYFGDVCGKTGQIDYDDIMTFVDEVLKAYPQIDQTRLGVTGGSYGGFMTNWIIGHTARFAAAASQRSTSNNISNEATTGNGSLFTKSCLKAGQERSDALLWDQSPLKYAERATTPTLFIAALEDYCCYHVESLQMYAALNRIGVDTRVCLFRHEHHGLSRTGRPEARIRRLQEITGWMDKYLK